jgi:hypothetical protein
MILFLAQDLTAPPPDPGQVLFPINPFGLDFHIDEPTPMLLHQAKRKPRWGSHGELANEYIRFTAGFEITWTLGNRAVLKCQTIDPFEEDTTNSYRAARGERVTVVSRQDMVPLFRGTVIDPRERAMEEPNTYTLIELDATDVSEDLAHRFITATFGGDPIPVAIALPGNPTHISMREPHGLNTGDTVLISDVLRDGGGGLVPHEANGERVVTVIDGMNFTVPVNSVGIPAGGGGTVEKLVHARDIIVSLSSILTEHRVSIDPNMGAGKLLRKVSFSETSVADVLRHVSGVSEQIHRFIPNYEDGFTLQMFEPGTVVAPWTIKKEHVTAGFKIKGPGTHKANTVIVKYGSPMTVTKAEQHVGDGVRRVFPLKYKYVSNGIHAPGNLYDHRTSGPQGPPAYRHVSVFGLDTLFEWQYRASDNALVQQPTFGNPPVATTPLAPGEVIETFFSAQFPQTVKVGNVPEGHQPREIIRHAPELFDAGAAEQFGWSELAKYNSDSRTSTIPTTAGLVWPGTAINVDLPHRQMTGQWLVMSVTMRERADGAITYEYTLIEGNKSSNPWQDKIRDLFGGSTGTAGGGSISGGSSVGPSPGIPPGLLGVTGTGTDDYIPVWTSANSLSNSPMRLNGAGAVEVEADIVALGDIVSEVDIVAKGAMWSPVMRASVVMVGTDSFTIQPDGEIVIDPGSGMMTPATNYEVRLGRIDRKYLDFHVAELWAETLVAQETIATIGGRIVISPTTQFVVDIAPSDTAIRVKHNNLANGHIVYMESSGRVEFMRVTSGPSGAAGNWSYTVARNLDGTGANQWYAGDAMVNTGTVGSGWIDIYSLRGMRAGTEVGPTIVGNVRTSTEYNAWEPRWAVGNLRGIYGYSTTVDIYGVAMGAPSGAWVKVDNVNGVRIGHGNSAPFAHFTMAGSASFSGSVTVTGGNAATQTYAQQQATAAAATRAAIDLSNVANAMVIAKTGWAYPGTTFIHGGNIFTGTIVANSIAAGSITADKLNVASLSAVSANLGTVTINGGGYIVTAGATWATGNGIVLGWMGTAYMFRAGNPAGNRIVWDGNNLEVVAGNITINGNGINVGTGNSFGGNRLTFGNVIMYSNDGNTLSVAGQFEATIVSATDLYTALNGTAHINDLEVGGSNRWNGYDSQNAGIGRPLVIADDGVLHRATNGISGGYSGGTFTFENGICVGHS